ncbi:MAG TPA: EAL domain-containing protein [Gemmatimonadaceae bacterium]|nr:EAL domain-containing protein [Gemmatimonadaceae bacterium]
MAVAFETPTLNDPPAGGRSFLNGTLAASMERAARLALAVLDVPCALVTFVGSDRRSFFAGSWIRPWFTHDSGAVVRSGLLTAILEQSGPLICGDARTSRVRALREAAESLDFTAMVAVTLRTEGGEPLGVLCAFDDTPREFDPRHATVLEDVASGVALEIELRRALADRERRERQLQHDSLHDPLTGLPNRSLFMRRLAAATARARRDDGAFALLFLDLDNFKLVNDSMGHHVGDDLLVAVARRLEQQLRGGDLVARLGGDEFAILLERVDSARDAALLAERVLESLATPLTIGGYEYVSSASMGLVLSSSASEQPEYLLRSADMAMYRAKSAGRARYEMFDRAMHAEALARLQTERDLRVAVEREEFELFYQPLVSIDTGVVVGVEALLRWRHPEQGLIAPLQFVPVAEDTGLIVPIGRWVLRSACRQAKQWHDELALSEPLALSVNLSVREFAQADLVKEIVSVLEETGFPAQSLQLEITESALIDHGNPAVNTIAELRSMGIRIHLDDFGTGFSSLSYLNRIPLDALKIDRAFTSAIDTEPRSRDLVRAIVELGRALGLGTVAEGVTRENQLGMLRAMGCRFAQGFLFSPPVPASELPALVVSLPERR